MQVTCQGLCYSCTTWIDHWTLLILQKQQHNLYLWCEQQEHVVPSFTVPVFLQFFSNLLSITSGKSILNWQQQISVNTFHAKFKHTFIHISMEVVKRKMFDSSECWWLLVSHAPLKSPFPKLLQKVKNFQLSEQVMKLNLIEIETHLFFIELNSLKRCSFLPGPWELDYIGKPWWQSLLITSLHSDHKRKLIFRKP